MSFSVRTVARGARIARNQTRQYATPASHPPGYVPSAEEFIAQRAAVQEHAAGETQSLLTFDCVELKLLTDLGTTRLWKNVRYALIARSDVPSALDPISLTYPHHHHEACFSAFQLVSSLAAPHERIARS